MLKNAISLDLAPLDACLSTDDDSILAIIIGVEGPSYRPLGAMMTIFETRASVGSLSSGCVEADIKLHALECLKSGKSTVVHYGLGSPYLDIVLPCGGGLQVMLVPNPCRDIIRRVLQAITSDRKSCTLEVKTCTGAISLTSERAHGLVGSVFRVNLVPAARFLVFGKGPEAVAFTALAQSVGYETTLLSPDPETREQAENISFETIEITRPEIPESVFVDARTAIVVFFHDHDWEPQILKQALATPAFYIGAQGSKRTRDNRHATLVELGVAQEDLARLRGPIGLINSARDARTLAISVLAEVVQSSSIERT
ncbi:MAG: XdhC family protein [Marinosulfonomonas sp.]